MSPNAPLALAPGERLLWSGAPRRGLTLRASDAYISSLPVGLVWTGLAVSWAVFALGDPGTRPKMKFWTVLIALASLYVTVWPLARGAWRRARTRYALTSRRLVVAVEGSPPTRSMLDLRLLPEATLTELANGSGTITFARTMVGPSIPIGPRRKGGERSPAPIAELENIPDARRVYGLVVAAQRALRSAPDDSPQPAEWRW